VYRRLRCNGHVINLGVQAFLFRSNTKRISDDEARSLSKYDTIDKEVVAQEWRDFGVLGQPHNLVVFSRASPSPLDKKKELMGWIDDNYQLFPNDALSHTNWQELKDIHEFLHPFFRVSKCQGRESTLDEVLWISSSTTTIRQSKTFYLVIVSSFMV
jgi:hypothetical protein